MNQTPRSNRYHIGIFGRRNTGKSSLMNALCGQAISIVSDIAGTTTDTVWKNIELPNIGAAVIADTAGYDDEGLLGSMRTESTRKAVQRIDIALLLLHGDAGDATFEKQWKETFDKAGIPVITLLGKCDNPCEAVAKAWSRVLQCSVMQISSKERKGLDTLIETIAKVYNDENNVDDITHSLVKAGDVVVLVMPQDAQAPKGRLIQPQVQTLRNLLDKHCLALCCTPEKLPQMLASLVAPPALIITDSQVFAQVQALTPPESRLTSFSVLMARSKGDIETFRNGADALMHIPGCGRVLIAESCSHIPKNEDIGRVKLPRLLRKRLGDGLTIDIVSGNDFPDDLTQYNVVIHCGACMFTRRHVLSRVRQAKAQGVPITNYGIAIAALTGILHKVVL